MKSSDACNCVVAFFILTMHIYQWMFSFQPNIGVLQPIDTMTENTRSTFPPNESSTTQSNCSLQCSSGFYCKVGETVDTCAPTCEWKEYPEELNTALDAIVVISTVIGVLAGIIVIITACLRWERVLVTIVEIPACDII